MKDFLSNQYTDFFVFSSISTSGNLVSLLHKPNKDWQHILLVQDLILRKGNDVTWLILNLTLCALSIFFSRHA